MIQTGSVGKVLITGGSSGLGLEMAKLFLEDGAEVYATGRKMPGSLSDNSRFHFIQVDFSDLRQVKKVFSDMMASKTSFDLIVNNAGILSPRAYTATGDGFEYTFQVNFLSHLLIDDLFLWSADAGKPARLALVTSPVYKYVKPSFNFPVEENYRPFRVYSETKYYLLFIGSFLKRKYPGKNIQIYALDPGIFSSGIYRMQKRWFHIMYMVGALFMRSSVKVATDLHQILIDPEVEGNLIYHRSGKRSRPFPEVSAASGKFMAACHDAVKIED
jgi:NAD(P)-dependent dehydrogenase (short-subunit alcohol dehydrogenase family)